MRCISKIRWFTLATAVFLCLTVLLSEARYSTETGRFAQAEALHPEESDLYAEIDDYLQLCVENARIPALSVSIVDKSSILFSGNYGRCESSDTPFLLGSVSKSFTAVCIMQLAEQGKLELDAPVSAYLPDAADGSRITVSQLLNHTSGLGEHQTLENCRIVNRQGEHNYANVNYSLLGEIIEAVSGLSYEEYISANIFEPLGLTHTAATEAGSAQNGLIGGYTNYWGIPVRRAHQYPSSRNAWITVPAGYLSSSANDLGKYLQMYLNGGDGILSGESIQTMFYGDTVYVEGDVPFWYGYGWSTVREPLTEPVLRHSGLVETGTSCIFLLPERGVAVAITANVNDYFVSNEMMDSLGWGVILMLLGEEPNEIAAGAYILAHLRIDMIMLAVLAASVLPWCFLRRYARSIQNRKKAPVLMELLLLHVLFPVFLLLLVPIFFATPLWVARAFVPDVFVIVVVSAALLFLCGLVKGVICLRRCM